MFLGDWLCIVLFFLTCNNRKKDRFTSGIASGLLD